MESVKVRSPEDFNHADSILVIGQNPGTNHPRMLTALRDELLNGSTIIHINPLPETGLVRFKHPQDYMKLNFKSTRLADIHVPIRIGGDAALFQAINNIIINKKKLNQHFIDEKTSGFSEYVKSLESIAWQRTCRDTGLDRELIEKIADINAF